MGKAKRIAEKEAKKEKPQRSIRGADAYSYTYTTDTMASGEETTGAQSVKTKTVKKPKKKAPPQHKKAEESKGGICTPCCAILTVLLGVVLVVAIVLSIVYPLDKYRIIGDTCIVEIDPVTVYKCASSGVCSDADAKLAITCITGSGVDKKCCFDKQHLERNPPKSAPTTAAPQKTAGTSSEAATTTTAAHSPSSTTTDKSSSASATNSSTKKP